MLYDNTVQNKNGEALEMQILNQYAKGDEAASYGMKKLRIRLIENNWHILAISNSGELYENTNNSQKYGKKKHQESWDWFICDTENNIHGQFIAYKLMRH